MKRVWYLSAALLLVTIFSVTSIVLRIKGSHKGNQQQKTISSPAPGNPVSDNSEIPDSITDQLLSEWSRIQKGKGDRRTFNRLLRENFQEGQLIALHKEKLSRFRSAELEKSQPEVSTYVLGDWLYAKIVVIDPPSGRILKTYYEIHEHDSEN